MRRHCGVARRQVQRGRARTCSGGHSYADGGRSYFGSVAPGRCNLRIACLVLLGILGALASAAEPIRYYKFPDGRIRLWLKGAPTVTATDVAGWQIEPAGKDKDRTWLARLGKSAESSPWKALLESLESGTEPSGVYAIEPKATIELNADGSITVSTTGGLSKQVAGQKKPLSDYVALVLGVKAGAVVSALDNYAHAASETDFLDSFIAAARAANAPPLIIDSGNGPVVLAVHAAALPATTSSPNSPPTESTTSLQPSSAPLTTPIPWLPIGFAAGGLAIGFGAGWALKRPKEVTVRVPATPAKTAAVRPPNPVADEAWRKERDETLKVLEEERASSRRYKAESDAAAARLKQAQDDAARTRQELGHQIQALQRSGQSAQSEARALGERCGRYAALARIAAEAMGFLQAEIGRPEIASAVGYLLDYSCATLLECISPPRPSLERALLANIQRIAGAFPSSPHARKLAFEAKTMAAPLGEGSIEESKHAHNRARQFDEILRLLRNQRNLDLSPFYFDVDDSGAAHAVYV